MCFNIDITVSRVKMGSACCVASKDTIQLPGRTSSQGPFRNVRYSPAWNCRWDSQGRVAEEVQNPAFLYSHGTSLDFGSTTMDSIDVECGDLSERQSQVDFQTSIPQNSPNHEDAGFNSMSSPSERSIGGSSLNEGKDSRKLSPVAGPTPLSPSFSRPPTSSSSPVSNGYHPRRHISDGRHSNLWSPNNSISEERESDSWSMSTFSELVASQRERWSFDSENIDNPRAKVTRSNTIDLRTCGVCLKLLMEKSPWVTQKFIVGTELSVVSVLVCGHVYHAECLDNTTPETSRFDPPCPVCTSGDKHGLKIHGKTVRIDTDFKSRNRISRNRVVDSNLGFDFSVPDHWRREGKGPMLGSSSSMKSSLSKPFLRRHFSLGSKSSNNKSMLESEFNIKSPKKGFWSRYRKG